MSLRCAALLLAVAWVAACAPPPPEHPNIVLVIGDDHGWPDSGFMGSPDARTPNLDRLAREGTVFTRAYNTASVCRPSLRTLLTGLHPIEFRVRAAALRRRGLRGVETEWIGAFDTLPRLLGRHGYATYQAGKFWEADYAIAGFGAGMQKTGDDPGHGGSGRFLGRGVPLDEMLAFADAHERFFVWFAPMLPHVPFDATEEERAPFRVRGLSGAAASYLANVSRLDDLVGQLLDHLEAAGLGRRTLVVYLSDNGWDQERNAGRESLWGGPHGKDTLHELGFRTPLVFWWPGVVPAGMRSDGVVSTVDLFPTLLEYAGVPVPDDRSGASLRPVIQQGAAWEREEVIGVVDRPRIAVGPATERASRGHAGSGWFLTTGDWWYLRYPDLDSEELYDRREGPRPLHDLAPERPELVARLRADVQRWIRERRRLPEAAGAGPQEPLDGGAAGATR